MRTASAVFVTLFAASAPLTAQAQTAPVETTVRPGVTMRLGGTTVEEDNRQPSANEATSRLVRFMSVGVGYCTAFQISNGAFLTAGHCFSEAELDRACPASQNDAVQIQYNVPLSTPEGGVQFPPADDIYQVPWNSIICQYQRKADGDIWLLSDWAIFAAAANKASLPADTHPGFFRPYRPGVLPLKENQASIRLTGYGVTDIKPYNRTQQSAIGIYVSSETIGEGGKTYANILYTTDSAHGVSGGPVVNNGTIQAIGINTHGRPYGPDRVVNAGTAFLDSDLSDAIHRFPGTRENPVIPASNISYVDNGAFIFNDAPDGNFFRPYQYLSNAFDRAERVLEPLLIVAVKGGYPEKVGADGITQDIDLKMTRDVTLLVPVGNVTMWGKVDELR
jgi:V8-like Glu-specific endopeptidase